MDRSKLREIILEQNNREERIGLTERENFSKVESRMKNDLILIISGIRRCGKSTLLNQLRKKYEGYYFNFDDERLLNFGVDDFAVLEELFLELYGKKEIFYFDEIQNIPYWERFVRRLHDDRKKIIITGSNASMLSSELGTHLTGRYLPIEMFPFSFREFLEFKKFKLDKNSFYNMESRVKIKKYFLEYFNGGGFPDYIRENNEDFLKTLYDNIIYRDILARYKLPDERNLKELVNFSVSNISKELSFNSITKVTGIKNSTTVKNYFEYLENSFLLFLVPKFYTSLKKQSFANKKVFCVDNGLAKYVGFRVSDDFGRMLENLVFIELKRKGEKIFYFQQKNECDFIIKSGAKITEAIQVCYNLTSENRQRELNGVLEAMEEFKLEEGLILTNEQEEEIIIDGKKIVVKPIWEWLLLIGN